MKFSWNINLLRRFLYGMCIQENGKLNQLREFLEIILNLTKDSGKI